MLLLINLHEAVLEAEGNCTASLVAHEVLPLRLYAYKSIPKELFTETERLLRILQQDSGYFAQVRQIRRASTLDDADARARNRSNAAATQGLESDRE